MPETREILKDDSSIEQEVEIKIEDEGNIYDFDNAVVISDSEGFEIIGTPEQRREAFIDWSLYTGEIVNPENTITNTFFKAKYSPLNEVLKTIRPILSNHGFGIMQTPYTTETHVYVRTVLLHRSGTIFSFPTFGAKITGKGDGIQAIGSIITYLRRFGINAICSIMGEVDDDGNKAGQSARNKEQTEAGKLAKTILSKFKELIEKGIEKDVLYDIVAEHNGNKNPNSIKDVSVGKKIIEEFNKIDKEVE